MSEYLSDDEGYRSDMLDNVTPELAKLSMASLNFDAMENLLLWMVRMTYFAESNIFVLHNEYFPVFTSQYNCYELTILLCCPFFV